MPFHFFIIFFLFCWHLCWAFYLNLTLSCLVIIVWPCYFFYSFYYFPRYEKGKKIVPGIFVIVIISMSSYILVIKAEVLSPWPLRVLCLGILTSS